MSQDSSTNATNEPDYEKLKDLLKFFYAQYRYNVAAGGVGYVGKIPRRSSNCLYPLEEHLSECDLPASVCHTRLQINDMRFDIKFSSQGYMGSNKCTFISLVDTRVGLYLDQRSVRARSGKTTDKEFKDFFTWNDPSQEPTTLYLGEQYNYDEYGSYEFDKLGLSSAKGAPATPELKDLFNQLQKLNDEALSSQNNNNNNNDDANEPSQAIIDAPHNQILFGAPGTGKSYTLNQQAAPYPHQRVTFHPDYTYAQFVGSYKPVMSAESKSGIAYSYVAGPFITTLIAALKNPNIPHILIIEEINRADPAAVFGEIFQLLDRNEEGSSEYSVRTSPELQEYLQTELTEEGKQNLHALVSSNVEPQKDYDCSEIAMPNNMYIWASMNSADQGVFPMDTAFKRRWTFQYLSIDGDAIHPAHADGAVLRRHWNDIRTNINNLLKTSGQDIPEDKLLGRYFLADPIDDEETPERLDADFAQAFSSKVIMYLFEDAARYCRTKIFATPADSPGQLYLSDLLRNLDTSKPNLGIFAGDVMPLHVADESAESEELEDSDDIEESENSENTGIPEETEEPEESAA